jgi:hypothetical protein
MKHIALTLTALLAAASAYAQGTVNFATRVTGQVDAPVTYQGAKAGDAYYGQLYAGAKGGTLAAVGQPVPFRSDAGIGYITAGGAVAVPGVAGGAEADIRLVAWAKSQGATYDAAKALNMGGWNESPIITVKTGNPDAVPPTVAANLVGLQGFEISPIIPEPSIAALGLLGAGLLLIRRKK